MSTQVSDPASFPAASCTSFISLPHEEALPAPIRAALYIGGLLYCFLGLGLISQKYMEAMDNIVKQTRTITYRDEYSGQMLTRKQRIWNPTMADITLLALGTSAPPISLAIISAVQRLGVTSSGADIGTGTMFGGAAFNFFAILACCILIPPSGTIKKVAKYGVFVVELLWSIWAYIWLYIVFQLWTPGEVTLVEGVVTVLHMPVLMLHAYAQDQQWPLVSIPEAGNEESFPLMKHHGSFDDDGDVLLLGQGSERSNCPLQFKDLAPAASASKTEDALRSSSLPPLSESASTVSFSYLELLSSDETLGTGSAHRVEVGPPFSPQGSQDQRPSLQELRGGREGVLSPPPSGVQALKETGDSPELSVLDPSAEPEVFPYPDIDQTNICSSHQNGSPTLCRLGIHRRPPATSLPGEADSDTLQMESQVQTQLTVNGAAAPGGISSLLEGNGDVDVFLSLEGMRKRPSGHHEADRDPDSTTTGCISTLSAPKARSAHSPAIRTLSLQVKDGEVKDSTFYLVLYPPGQRGGGGESTLSDGLANSAVYFRDRKWWSYPASPEGNRVLGAAPLRWRQQILDALQLKIQQRHEMQDGAQETIEQQHNQECLKESPGNTPIVHPSGSDQLQNAFILNSALSSCEGSQDQSHERASLLATLAQRSWHMVSLLWRILFALIVPPPELFNGWPAFLVSICIISLISTVVIALAGLLGCITGVDPFILAITLLASGTAIPNVISSAIAAQQSPYADSAIANINASNAINVYLGLGLPWVITASYNTFILHSQYVVDASTLGPSLLVYFGTIAVGLLVLFTRRWVLGGELGGKRTFAVMSSLTLMGLWGLYCILSLVFFFHHE